MALGFGFLVWVNRNQWFSGDEWDLLARRGIVGSHELNIFQPHNEHWITIPILVYRALFSVFGVRTYYPYLLLMIAVQVLVAHLLWRLMLRVGVDPLIATAASAIFVVIGAGWENLVNAFQFTFIAPIALGLIAILVMPERGRFQRRDVYGWICSLIAIMCSGLGITIVLVLGGVALLRRGWRVALAVVSVPGIVYLLWYAKWGHNAHAVEQQPLSTSLQKAPAFVWHGLVTAIDAATGLEMIAPTLLVLLGIWLVRMTDRPEREPWPILLSLVIGAPLFLFLIDIRRSGLGVATAGAPRYGYVIVAFLLPVFALAASRILEGNPLRFAIALSVTAVLLLVSVSTLTQHANALAPFKQENRRRIVAAAALVDAGAPLIANVPAPEFDPELNTTALATLSRDGKLPSVAVDTVDRLTAAEFLQLALGPAPAAGTSAQARIVGTEGAQVSPTSRPECFRVTATSDHPTVFLEFAEPGWVELTSQRDGQITAATPNPGSAKRREGQGTGLARVRRSRTDLECVRDPAVAQARSRARRHHGSVSRVGFHRALNLEQSAMTSTEAGSASEVATALPTRRNDRLAKLVAWIVVGIAALAAGALLLHLGRGTTWFYDEWDWVLHRRTGSVDDFLRNHNGHLNLLPVLAYKASWALFGLGNYTPLRAFAIVLHIATCVLFFVYARRRSPIWFAVALTVMIVFLGRAWSDLLWPFQIQYVGAITAGLAALLLLDRHDRLGDVGASVALGAAVACSGVGLPFVGAVTLELLWRRSTWRKLWIPLAPLALYGMWYLEYGAAQAKASNIHLVPGYTERAGAASTGALFGQNMNRGHVLLAILVVAVVVVVAVRRHVSPRFAAVLALPLLYWVLTALSRAQLNEPDASRYLYPGAIFVALVLVELAHLVPLPRSRTSLVILLGAVVAVTVVSVRGNEQPFRLGAAGLRDASTYVKAELAALELAGSRVEPGFQPDPVRAPQITAGPYAEAVADLGSPADSINSVRSQSEAVRSAADGVLVRALGLGLRLVPTATSGGALPRPVVRQGTSAVEDDCIVITPQGVGERSNCAAARLRSACRPTRRPASTPQSVTWRAASKGRRSGRSQRTRFERSHSRESGRARGRSNCRPRACSACELDTPSSAPAPRTSLRAALRRRATDPSAGCTFGADDTRARRSPNRLVA